MSAFIDLVIDQGTDYNTVLYVTDDDTNAVANIAGYTVMSQMRKSYVSANVTANLNCQITDSANGIITLTLPYYISANIDPGKYVFDVVTINTSNTRTRLIEGTIRINPGVTR